MVLDGWDSSSGAHGQLRGLWVLALGGLTDGISISSDKNCQGSLRYLTTGVFAVMVVRFVHGARLG